MTTTRTEQWREAYRTDVSWARYLRDSGLRSSAERRIRLGGTIRQVYVEYCRARARQ